MPKMKVTCNRLYFGDRSYATGEVFEATAEEALELIKDGNATPTTKGEPLSEGIFTIIDPIERDLRDGKFKEVREAGVMTAPPGAESVSTPPVGPAASAAGMARVPADAIVEPYSAQD